MTTAKIHADSPYSDAEKAEDMRTMKLVLDDYTRNGIATMTESEKVLLVRVAAVRLPTASKRRGR